MVTVWEPYGKDLLTTLKLQSSIGNFLHEIQVYQSTKAARFWRRPLASASATKPQSLDELLVLLRLGRFQIIEELAALVDELDQPAP